MDVTIQKNRIIAILFACSSPMLWANTNPCATAPIVAMGQTVGQARYFAQNCQDTWQNQSIRLDFIYSREIPDWALKRAANHLLSKNWAGYRQDSALNQITALYRPVKRGDHYTFVYSKNTQTLTLLLNQQVLGSLQNTQANQYFQIWFGASPFNVKLKQQLLMNH